MAKIFNKIMGYIGLEEDELSNEEYAGDNSQSYQYQSYKDDYQAPEENYDESQYSSRRKVKSSSRENKVINMYQTNNSNKIIIYQPINSEDAQNMIDSLKTKKPVVANFESVGHENAQRILDIMSGAMYALGGNVYKVASGIYVFAPENVDVSGNIFEGPSGMPDSAFFGNFNTKSQYR